MICLYSRYRAKEEGWWRIESTCTHESTWSSLSKVILDYSSVLRTRLADHHIPKLDVKLAAWDSSADAYH
jgi:hypothetical protein